MRQYDGPVGNIPSLGGEGWVDTVHREVEGPWHSGESKRRVRFTVRARSLPHEGTYVLKILVTKWVPLGTPREQLMDVVSEDDIPEETRQALIRSSLAFYTEKGIDPDQEQKGAFGGEGIHTIYIVDYFRVEPLSSVLTFLIATGSLLTAATGILVAVIAIWG